VSAAADWNECGGCGHSDKVHPYMTDGCENQEFYRMRQRKAGAVWYENVTDPETGKVTRVKHDEGGAAKRAHKANHCSEPGCAETKALKEGGSTTGEHPRGHGQCTGVKPGVKGGRAKEGKRTVKLQTGEEGYAKCTKCNAWSVDNTIAIRAPSAKSRSKSNFAQWTCVCQSGAKPQKKTTLTVGRSLRMCSCDPGPCSKPPCGTGTFICHATMPR